MADLLVKLYDIAPDSALVARLAEQGVTIVRALAPDARHIVSFVEASTEAHWPGESKERWASECAAAMANHPPTCFVAVQDRSVVGFACYDATAKGYFGPLGVLRQAQRMGIGRALLIESLLAMWNDGYGYAIVGWPAPGAVDFYRLTVRAVPIEGSSPGIYRRLIGS